MRRPRGRAQLALALVACAWRSAPSRRSLSQSAADENAAPTTGEWAPITVTRPNVPVIGGGIPVDLDPMVHRDDLSIDDCSLPGTHRYAVTISNISDLGAINSFQWYPPSGVRVLKVLGSSRGPLHAHGPEGLRWQPVPDGRPLSEHSLRQARPEAPSCTCLGDGGADDDLVRHRQGVRGRLGELRMRTATLVFDRIPSYLKSGSPASPG